MIFDYKKFKSAVKWLAFTKQVSVKDLLTSNQLSKGLLFELKNHENISLKKWFNISKKLSLNPFAFIFTKCNFSQKFNPDTDIVKADCNKNAASYIDHISKSHFYSLNEFLIFVLFLKNTLKQIFPKLSIELIIEKDTNPKIKVSITNDIYLILNIKLFKTRIFANILNDNLDDNLDASLCYFNTNLFERFVKIIYRQTLKYKNIQL